MPEIAGREDHLSSLEGIIEKATRNLAEVGETHPKKALRTM
jgi:hypothetical protein